MTSELRQHYDRLARFYDIPIPEVLFYGTARRRAVDDLQLASGDTVLDVACGTGLNLPLLRRCVSPGGTIVGIDLSEGMLERANRRSQSWDDVGVCLVQGDAGNLSEQLLREAGCPVQDMGFDGVISSLGLSVIPDWKNAYDAMVALARPGGRVSIMDAGYPEHPGDWDERRVLRPVWRVACKLAGVQNPAREPWERAKNELSDVSSMQFSGGYVWVVGGTA